MEIKDRLNYNPTTGIFTWRTTLPRMRAKVGDRAGYSDDPRGYRRIKIAGKRYLEQRLAVYLMTGEWPVNDVDHINHDPSDNRWSNLRQCTTKQNHANKKPRGQLGLIGVTKSKKRFMAKGYNRTYLGIFDTPEEAAAVSYKHRQEAMGEFFYGRT